MNLPNVRIDSSKSEIPLSNRNPIGKRLKDKRYYEKHKERIKKVKLERQKIRYIMDSDYKFRQDVEASHRGFKKQIFQKFNNKCCKCGLSENLQLHHLKYIKGKEGLPFVIALCKICHYKTHYPLPEMEVKTIWVR